MVQATETLIIQDKDVLYRPEDLQKIFELSTDLFIVTDPKATVSVLNPAWEKLLGYPLEVIRATNGFEFVHPEDRQKTAEVMESVREGQPGVRHVNRLLTRNGQVRTVEWSIHLSAGMIYSTGRDITDYDRIVHELDAERRKLGDIVEAVGIGIWEWNIQTDQAKLSPRWAQLLGYTLAELEPINGNIWGRLGHPDDLKLSRLTLQRHIDGELDRYVAEIRMLHKNGSWIWMLERGRIVSHTPEGEPLMMFGTLSDIHQIKLAEQNNLYLSYHDPLTGLYNRRFLQEQIQRLNGSRKLPIALIMGDVDNLKLMNDTFGHLKGDDLICSAALAIKDSCRPDDIIARWGGDEFVLLLPNTDDVGVKGVLRRIRHRIRDLRISNLPVRVSFGWALKASQDQDMEEILIQAEQNMYQSKNAQILRNVPDLFRELSQRFPESSQAYADIQIIGDRYDSLVAHPDEGAGLTPEAAIRELRTEQPGCYDPALVDYFVETVLKQA